MWPSWLQFDALEAYPTWFRVVGGLGFVVRCVGFEVCGEELGPFWQLLYLDDVWITQNVPRSCRDYAEEDAVITWRRQMDDLVFMQRCCFHGCLCIA